MNERIHQALDDADAAIERHVRGRDDADEARRAINESMGALYRAFSGLQMRPGFWDAADRSLEGKTMQALMYVRGKAEHTLIEAHEEEVLFPGDDTYPSDDIYPGVNYWWLVWGELEPLLEPGPNQRDRRPEVRRNLAGRLVVQGLRRSVRHLRWSLANLV